jgi:hypothetical protein
MQRTMLPAAGFLALALPLAAQVAIRGDIVYTMAGPPHS